MFCKVNIHKKFLQSKMEASGQGEGELRRRKVDGEAKEEEDNTVVEEQVEVKENVVEKVVEKVVDSEAEDRAIVGEEIAKSIGQDKPPEVQISFLVCSRQHGQVSMRNTDHNPGS